MHTRHVHTNVYTNPPTVHHATMYTHIKECASMYTHITSWVGHAHIYAHTNTHMSCTHIRIHKYTHVTSYYHDTHHCICTFRTSWVGSTGSGTT